MRLQLRYHITAKLGCAPEECEDALGLNLEARSFAVTDGATEAFAAGQWAKHLAHKWALSEVRPLEPHDFRAWVAAQGGIWHDGWKDRKLPWYAEAKERDGSFAAFVGVKLDELPVARWRALALGDACLFHRHDDKMVRALPLDAADKFNATPQLVPSRPELHEKAFKKTLVAAEELRLGDVLWLASDAAAAWLLRAWEAHDPLAAQLEEMLCDKRADELNELLTHQRQAGAMTNDDVALVRIEILEI
jgi:hypothetical protein